MIDLLDSRFIQHWKTVKFARKLITVHSPVTNITYIALVTTRSDVTSPLCVHVMRFMKKSA
jgi:hypothetical protein